MRDPAAKRLSGRVGVDDNTSAKRELRLFIDSNGGKRKSIIIQTGILRALQEQGVGAKAIFYADYNPGSERWKKPVKVYDKQAEYEIFDIVSGIDEFVEYGRVGKLRQYFKHSHSGICEVLDCIQKMCDAFTTCFANPMVESVAEAARALQAFLHPKEAQCSGILPESKIEPDELERYVISQIYNDLGEEMMTCALNSGSGASLAILPMIRWCYRKQFYQQAATLYVEKMSEWYAAKGIIREELGWSEADIFYEKAYMNRFEVNYKSRICALMPRRAEALIGLDCLCWDAGLRLDRRIVEQSRAYIEGHYDKGGSVNSGLSDVQPLRDYVKSLKNINGIFCDIKDNHDLNMRKSRFEQKVNQFLPAVQHPQQSVTRSAVTNMLNSLKNSQGNYRMDYGVLEFDDDMMTQDKIRFNHLIIRDLINGAIAFNEQWERTV